VIVVSRPASRESRDPDAPPARRVGRPPLTPEAIADRIAAYCDRYGVAARVDGLPPFPSGRRETRQHREWLTLYKVHQRQLRRTAATREAVPHDRRARPSSPDGVCPVCEKGLAGAGVAYRRENDPDPDHATTMHPPCAELARLASAVGRDAFGRLAAVLWPEARAQSGIRRILRR